MASNSLFSNHPTTLAYVTEQLKASLNKPINNKYTSTNSLSSIGTNSQIGSLTDQIMYHYRQAGRHLKQITTITVKCDWVSCWPSSVYPFLLQGPAGPITIFFLSHDLLTAKLLLALASTVIIGSEFHGTHDHKRGLILLWLYKGNKLRDWKKMYLLYIFPPKLHTLMTWLF
jgi:hypothetical protein